MGGGTPDVGKGLWLLGDDVVAANAESRLRSAGLRHRPRPGRKSDDSWRAATESRRLATTVERPV